MDPLHCSARRFRSVLATVMGLCLSGSAGAATFYVSPTGNDGNSGSYSAPWRTITASVLAANNKLHPGDTLYVRGGTYNETNVVIDVSGTSTAPITIKSYGNEKPVLDGALTGPQIPNNPTAQWVVEDAANNIYRSVNTFPSASYAAFVGGRFTANGKTWSLISYSSRTEPDSTTVPAYSYLSSNIHNYNEWTSTNTVPARYLGPGVCFGKTATPLANDYIYIRLQPPQATALYLTTPYPTWYTDLTSVFNANPTSNDPTLDPRTYDIDITGVTVGVMVNGNYGVWDGIDVKNYQYGFTGNISGNGSNWTYRNMTVTPGQIAFKAPDNCTQVLVDNVVSDTRLPQWVAWLDVKGGDAAGDHMKVQGYAASAHSIMSGSTLVTLGSITNLEIKNCTFTATFDATQVIAGIAPDGTTEQVHDIHIHHNRATEVRDDFCQLCSTAYNVEEAYNAIKGAGPSHQGSGDTPAGYAGTKYIHHNIIDTTTEELIGRLDPNGYRNPPAHAGDADRGWAGAIPFSNHHDGTCPKSDPWKIYQNTVVFSNRSKDGVPGEDLYCDTPDNTTGVPHEVYNNIFQELQINTFNPGNLSSPNRVGTDARNRLTRTWQVDALAGAPKEIYDGDLFGHLSGGNTTDNPYFDVWDGGTAYQFFGLTTIPPTDPLAFFKNSPQFTHSKVAYPPGIENSGTQFDPNVTSILTNIPLQNYRPLASSLALSGGVDISAKTTWPGISNATYRGVMPRIVGPADSALMGYWTFDDATGTTAEDLSGRSHPGTLTNGPTWVCSKPGVFQGPTALQFDHVNDYVSIPNNADFNFGANTNFSVTAWIKVDNGSTVFSPIVMKGKTGVGGKRYLFAVDGSGRLKLEIDDDVNEYVAISPSTGPFLNDGRWHFVAATLDRAGYSQIYIDSSTYISRAFIDACGSIDDTTTPLTIGAITTGGNCYFAGSIDEVRIYNRVLLGTELDTLAK